MESQMSDVRCQMKPQIQITSRCADNDLGEGNRVRRRAGSEFLLAEKGRWR